MSAFYGLVAGAVAAVAFIALTVVKAMRWGRNEEKAKEAEANARDMEAVRKATDARRDTDLYNDRGGLRDDDGFKRK